MKTWEKIQKLDSEYQSLRQKILLGQVEEFDIKITLKNTSVAALLTPTKGKKNDTKSSKDIR